MNQMPDIVEAYNMPGTVFYGTATNFEDIKPILEKLRLKGELHAVNNSILIYEYLNKDFDSGGHCEPFRTKKASYKNGWRIEE